MLGVVAAEGRGRGDDGAELRLGVARGRVQGDLAAQALDVADSIANLGFAELDFYRCPAAIVQLDDGIDLKPVGVAVVVERARMRAGQTRGVDTQIVNAQRLKEQAKSLAGFSSVERFSFTRSPLL